MNSCIECAVEMCAVVQRRTCSIVKTIAVLFTVFLYCCFLMSIDRVAKCCVLYHSIAMVFVFSLRLHFSHENK